MRSRIKTSILLSALTACVIGGTFGTVTGTVAWFAYSTRVSVSYSGTSISNTNQIMIGFVTTVDMSDYGFTSEVANGITYKWAPEGTSLTSDIISAYLERDSHGYATNVLCPVTSGEWYEDDVSPMTLSLKECPISGNPVISHAAGHDAYSVLPLCFKVKELGSDPATYRQSSEVWVTDVEAQASSSSTGNVADGLRVYFNSHSTDGTHAPFILKPNAVEAGKTAVAGSLNLNHDKYYDYDPDTGEEYIYGDYTGTPTGTYNAEDTEIVDMNNTGNDTTVTTFTAKHHAGTTSYTGYTPKKQSFLSISDILPHDNVGDLSGGRPVCITSDDTYAIGVCTLTIWLEGWDHSVIDSEIGHQFNLGIQFQVNR